MTITTRPEWSRRLHASLDASDARARELAAGLTVEQLNWRADQSSWSIGQCLDHLRVANEVYGRAIASALSGTPGGPVDQITPERHALSRDATTPSTRSVSTTAVPVARTESAIKSTTRTLPWPAHPNDRPRHRIGAR